MQHAFILAPHLADVLMVLIRKTREAVRELDSQQGQRFQRKLLLGIKESNGSDSATCGVNGRTTEDVSTGEDSTVRVLFSSLFC